MKQPRCPHDPRTRAGLPIGMYHCPECGCMVVAGLDHGECVMEPDCPYYDPVAAEIFWAGYEAAMRADAAYRSEVTTDDDF